MDENRFSIEEILDMPTKSDLVLDSEKSIYEIKDI